MPAMSQLTIRADEALVERVRRAAHDAGRSMNDYVTAVLDAATDPDLGGTEAERLRDRLAAAGLLDTPGGPGRRRPDEASVSAARRRAGRGTPLSDLVTGGR